MPFKSQAQRRFMYSQHPEMAKRWEDHTPKGTKLPDHIKKRPSEKKAAEVLTDLARDGLAGASVLLAMAKAAGNLPRNEGYGSMVGSVGNAGQGLLSVNNLAKPNLAKPMIPGLSQPSMPPHLTQPMKAAPPPQLATGVTSSVATPRI